MATYAAMLASGVAELGLRAEVLLGAPRLPRAVRWAAAAWPGRSPSWMRGGARRAPDVFRIAQVHFDIYGRLRGVGGRGLPDVMHWTYPLPLVMPGRRNVYTVHDLIPLLHPALTGIEAGRFRRMLGAVLGAADQVVTVSEATRGELISHMGLDPARVTNTLQAVDVAGAVDAGVPGLVRRGYWLHVGAVERRKNLRRLIAAWRASGTVHPLVLAGPDGWMAAETLADAAPFLRAEGAPLEGPCIVRLPWLERARLLGLMRDARGVVMPSLAEGFGLPVVEALALATPVLTSAGGALAEVAAGAAVLVDPLDVGDMAAGLQALDGDAGLRGDLVRRGLARAVVFSREAYARRLAGLYGVEGSSAGG